MSFVTPFLHKLLLASGLVIALTPSAALSQSPSANLANPASISTHHASLPSGFCPLVADPKLENGDIEFNFGMPNSGTFDVTISVTQGSGPAQLVRHLSTNQVFASGQMISDVWDGLDQNGNFVAPGAYDLRIWAKGSKTHALTYPIHIVRLGISEIEALPSAANNEWQMVYFRKNDFYKFYATPSMAEYSNRGDLVSVSDLDLDNGSPRPAPALHITTDEPVMNGTDYEEFNYNYPICYIKGSNPLFEVKTGATCTSVSGLAGDVGYPISGIEIRMVAADTKGAWLPPADNIQPGQTYQFAGPALSDSLGREDRTMAWGWRYRETGSSTWIQIPGRFTIDHRFYTTYDEPNWAIGASGTQYTGPWIEVMDYMHEWSTGLAIDTSTDAGVVEALIRGFFGQDGPLTTAIEGVLYDTYTVGGDGGASHYYNWNQETIRLKKLLHEHDLGPYVNCSDVSSSTSAMLAMLGIDNMRMFHISGMTLNAIWGIGTSDYTMDLWGTGGHSFSYHHIITRDGGTHVSDSCMWLDEDGNPGSLPGTPGQSFDRPWAGPNGYDDLSCSNHPNTYQDPLPEIN